MPTITKSKLAILRAGLLPAATSNEEAHQALQALADGLDRETPQGTIWHWVEQSFDDGRVVLSQEGPEGQKFFETTFTANDDGMPLAFGAEMTEVRRKVEFLAMEAGACPCRGTPEGDNDEGITPSTTKEVDPMANEAKVTALIDHEGTKFTEANKAFLLAMSDEELDLLTPDEEAAPAAEPDAPEGDADAPETMEAAIALMPAHLQGTMQAALQVQTDARSALITALDANELCTYTKEQLEAKDTADLQSLTGIMAHTAAPVAVTEATVLATPVYVAAQAPAAAEPAADGITVATIMKTPHVNDYKDDAK